MEAPRTAFPLTWPTNRPRTPVSQRKAGKFRAVFSQARDELLEELARLGARKAILSSDAPMRRDGLPYADADPSDPACAVYFERAGRPYVIACDTYTELRANVRAVSATIQALRAIERHGSSALLEQAFTGFVALPPARAAEPSWWEALGVSPGATVEEIEAAHRQLAFEAHPDRGGDAARMAQINRARDVALEEREQ